MRSATFVLTATLILAARAAAAGVYSDYAETTHPIDAAVPAMVGEASNPIFTAWASGYVNYLPSPGVSAGNDVLQNAFGPADNVIVSLGDLEQTQIDAGAAPGEIALTFGRAIYNGPGADFAVFENSTYYEGWGFFAELGYVEVSSNGTDFARFDSISTNDGPVGPYGLIDGTNIYNLAGKHQSYYGTPFDLATLAAADAVTSGLVDLGNIRYVKIVDVPGSGDFCDSKGNPIYDAWPTFGPGGFDLDAVGAINTVPEPGSAALMAGLIFAAAVCRCAKRDKRISHR